MAQRTKAAFKTTKNSRFASNTSGAITAANSQDMYEDVADSALFIEDNAYSSFVVTASGTDTYTATLSPAITSYTTGAIYRILFTNANTGAATLNLNSVGAKSIKKNGSSALIAGDIPAASYQQLMYDGTNLQLLGNIGGGGTTLAAGTYTPTVTAVANVTTVTANECQYLRVGASVTVSGEVNITPTAASATTTIRITLPVATNLANEHECAGTAVQELTGGAVVPGGGLIKGDTTNDEAFLKFLNNTVTSSAPWFFTFTYRII